MSKPNVFEPRMMWFWAQMDKKMRMSRNQAKEDWRNREVGDLIDMLRMEVDELEWEVDNPKSFDGNLERAIVEAADVANLAMMVGDKLKSMRS